MIQTAKPSISGLLAGLTAAAIWGGMYVVSKAVLAVIPPFALLSSRLLLGAAALALVIALRRKKQRGTLDIRRVLAVGFVGYGISLGFQFVGTKLSTASNGSLVTSATPAFILLFASFLLGEKPTPRKITALALATLGVIAVIDPTQAKLQPELFLGNLCLLGAALTWALYSVLVRKITGTSDVLAASALMLLGGLPVTVPMAVWEAVNIGIGTITPAIVGGILFLGIISTAIAMFLWNFAFAKLPAATASLTFFAQPVVGTLLGALFLGEKIMPLFFLGGALIGIGIIIQAKE